MLRYTPGDSIFFIFLKSYAMDILGGFKHNSSSTDDVTAKLTAVAGQDVSPFIQQWLKEPNHNGLFSGILARQFGVGCEEICLAIRHKQDKIQGQKRSWQ